MIRLLTIHSAKGLEFKVVVVADAGRDRGRHDADEILCLPDGRLGFRVAEPSTGKRLSTSEYESVKTAEQDAEGAERLRLYYVAMTRAIDRLIVSGAIDQDRKADANTPIGWVLDRLDASELERGGSSPDGDRARRSAAADPPRPALAGGCESSRRPRWSSSSSSSRWPRMATPRPSRPSRSRRWPRFPLRRSTGSVDSPTARSRSSSAARTGTSPNGSSDCGPPTRQAPCPGRRGSQRPRSATRSMRCSSAST